MVKKLPQPAWTIEQTEITLTQALQKHCDHAFAAQTGLSTLILMEQAAQAVTECLVDLAEILRKERGFAPRIIYLAGSGNNGGDAWASARQLMALGYQVDVLDLSMRRELTPDAAINRLAYRALGGREINLMEFLKRTDSSQDSDATEIKANSQQSDFSGASLLLVDGILGSGYHLERPLEDPIPAIRNLFEQARRRGAKVVAIDIPTGVECDTGAVDPYALKADLTVTFSARKTGIAAAPGCAYAGKIFVAPISMSESWLHEELSAAVSRIRSDESASGNEFNEVPPRLLTQASIRRLEPRRSADSHKGTYGRVWLGGGTTGMAGAILLALKASRHTGVGYNFVRVPAQLVATILRIHPEALVAAIDSDPEKLHKELIAVDAVCIGPGAGEADWFVRRAELFMRSAQRLIIDADALNQLALIRDWHKLTRSRVWESEFEPCILTPHPGEFKRLAPDLAQLLKRDRQTAAAILAHRSQTIVILKGMATVIACPDGQIYLNPTGNDALAQAGSGDVLSGLLAGFAAQGMKSHEAAAVAVYLHGLLADLAVDQTGKRGIAPGDLVDYLPQAYRTIGWES